MLKITYLGSPLQILEAVARKMTVGPSVNFDEIASRTAGFSGADLQALMYNAHLDVIHSSIAEAAPSDGLTSNKVEEVPVKYTTIGASKDKIVLSRAEEMALQRRVSTHSICVCAFFVLLMLPSYSFGKSNRVLL